MTIRLLVMVCLAVGQPADNWHLEKEKDGISVFSRHLEGKKLKELRVRCTLPGTLSQLVAVLSDVDNYERIIYKTKAAHLIRRVSETEFSYYVQTEMPWPVANRDLVMHLTMSHDAATKTLTVRINDVPNAVPTTPGVVRVPHWFAEWQVRPISPDLLDVDYHCQVDPGGTLPAWLVNITAPTGPYLSFSQMRKNVGLPRYQNRSFRFLTK
jgi:hypothetical protein